MLYTSNRSAGYIQLQVKLGFVILPILLLNGNNKNLHNLKNIFYSFIIGNIIASLICLTVAFYLYSKSNIFVFKIGGIKTMLESTNFNYTELSIFQHTSYFSAFLSLAIAMIFYLIKKENKIIKKIFGFIIILFFCLIIFLLSARSGLLVLVLIIFGGLTFFIYSSKQKWVAILAFLIFGALFSAFTISNHRVRETIKKFFNSELKEENSLKKSEIRIAIWDVSLKAILKNPILGVGTGDFTEEAIKLYNTDELIYAKQNKLNMHNQFLESMYCNGIFAGFILLFIIGFALYKSITNKDFILFSFSIIIFVNFMFETMLSRQTGVIFFCFWFSLLMFNNFNYNQVNDNK